MTWSSYCLQTGHRYISTAPWKLSTHCLTYHLRGVLLGLVKTELETHLLQAQRRFFVVDDKATQIGTSVDQENTTCTATVCCKKSCHRHIIGTSNRSDLHSPPQFYINLTTKLVQTTVLKPVLHKFI